MTLPSVNTPLSNFPEEIALLKEIISAAAKSLTVAVTVPPKVKVSVPAPLVISTPLESVTEIKSLPAPPSTLKVPLLETFSTEIVSLPPAASTFKEPSLETVTFETEKLSAASVPVRFFSSVITVSLTSVTIVQ